MGIQFLSFISTLRLMRCVFFQTCVKMKTLKSFALVTLLTFVIIYQNECRTLNNTTPEIRDDKISFIETDSENDESEKVKEKIRKEMDEYRKEKESRKKKMSTTVETTSATTEAISSSTLVHVHLIGIEDSTNSNDYYEETTLLVNDTEATTVDNRNILTAQILCPDGKKLINNVCRRIY